MGTGQKTSSRSLHAGSWRESTLRRKTLDALAASSLLASGARVYLEGPADEPPSVPAGWVLHRSKRAGNVGYHLLVAGVAPAPST